MTLNKYIECLTRNRNAEKNLSTENTTPGAGAWFPGPHGYRQWAKSAEKSPFKGPLSPGRDEEQPRQARQLEELTFQQGVRRGLIFSRA